MQQNLMNMELENEQTLSEFSQVLQENQNLLKHLKIIQEANQALRERHHTEKEAKEALQKKLVQLEEELKAYRSQNIEAIIQERDRLVEENKALKIRITLLEKTKGADSIGSSSSGDAIRILGDDSSEESPPPHKIEVPLTSSTTSSHSEQRLSKRVQSLLSVFEPNNNNNTGSFIGFKKSSDHSKSNNSSRVSTPIPPPLPSSPLPSNLPSTTNQPLSGAPSSSFSSFSSIGSSQPSSTSNSPFSSSSSITALEDKSKGLKKNRLSLDLNQVFSKTNPLASERISPNSSTSNIANNTSFVELVKNKSKLSRTSIADHETLFSSQETSDSLKLKPTKNSSGNEPWTLPPLTAEDTENYDNLFSATDTNGSGFIDGKFFFSLFFF